MNFDQLLFIMDLAKVMIGIALAMVSVRLVIRLVIRSLESKAELMIDMDEFHTGFNRVLGKSKEKVKLKNPSHFITSDGESLLIVDSEYDPFDHSPVEANRGN